MPGFVDVKHFSTFVFTPPEFFYQGDLALIGPEPDLRCLGFVIFHLFTQEMSYDDIMGKVFCPAALKKLLKKLFTPKKGYSVIRDAIKNVGGREETLYHTVYRYLVFFSDESLDVFPKSSLSIEIRKWRDGLHDREQGQFQQHRQKFSLETGENAHIARARKQLQHMGGWDILLKLFSFNPADRPTPLKILESDFMKPLREDPDYMVGHDDPSDASEPQSGVCRYHRMPTSPVSHRI